MLSSRFAGCLSRSVSIHKHSKELVARSYASTSSVQLSGDVSADRIKVAQFSDLSNIPGVQEKDLRLVLEPYIYHAGVPVKNGTRYVVIDGYNHWLKLPSDLVARLESVVDKFWDCAFILDDVDDDHSFRRGLPTSQKLYGKVRTTVSGRAIQNLIFKELLELGNIEAIKNYNNGHIRFHTGQGKEVWHRDNQICPTLEEFEQLCSYKTTPFMSMICNLMQPFSKCKTDFSHFSYVLGIHCQYVNDTANLSDPNLWRSKGFCDDIRDGKYAFPLVHAIQSGTPESKIIAAILRQPEKDLAMTKYCYSLLKKVGSIDYCNSVIKNLEQQIRDELVKLGGNPVFDKYLDIVNEINYDEECQESFLEDLIPVRQTA